jgi:hypothetical protein
VSIEDNIFKASGIRPDDGSPVFTVLGGLRPGYVFVSEGRVVHWTKKKTESVSLAGVQVELQVSGNVNRVRAAGGASANLRYDDRKLFLAVTGTDGAFVVKLLLTQAEENARRFATQVTSLAMKSPLPTESRSSSNQTSPDAVDQIARLGDLRDKGLLTEAEFQAKKQELLDRL